LGGGPLTHVIKNLTQATGYVVAKDGIYYWTVEGRNQELRFWNIESQRENVLFRPSISAAPFLTRSPDGRWLCFPLIERYSQELMMLDNWR